MIPKIFALAGLLLTALVGGVFDVVFASAAENAKLWAQFGPMLAALGFIFMWLHYDGLQVGYRRSALLNVGIVALALVFIPVYFYRSRPVGARWPMFFRFVGVFILWIVFSAIGFYGTLAAT